MAYSDLLRTQPCNQNDIATLIDGVLGASGAALVSAAWTPSFTGFSANPAGGTYRYFQINKLAILSFYMPNDGTSNSTAFTITMPFTGGASWLSMQKIAGARDNTAFVNNAIAFVPGGSNVLTFYTDANSAGWTAAGGKRASGIFVCEVT